MSDSHAVRSHADIPIRTAAEYADSPMLDPFRVTLTDPVPAEFPRRITLAVPNPIVTTDVMLPDRAPAVTDSRELPADPLLAWLRAQVSDSHVVRSHAEWPVLQATVCDDTPRFDPLRVTLADPVPLTFPRLTTLTRPISNESASVALLTSLDAETTVCRLPIKPFPIWHRVEESDSHEVRSQADCPSRVATQVVSRPRFAPCTVTLPAPVAAKLLRRSTLKLPMSTLSPELTLPTRPPALMCTHLLPRIPLGTVHCALVSESQTVCSHAVWPIRAEAVYTASPILVPCKLTLADPVANEFHPDTTLTITTSNVKKVD